MLKPNFHSIQSFFGQSAINTDCIAAKKLVRAILVKKKKEINGLNESANIITK